MATDGRHHSTPDQRANAVARVLAGESRRKVADDCDVSEGTVRRWIAAAQRRGTAQEEKLASDAEKLADRIIDRQEEARELLINRIVALIPDTANLRDVTWAYGVLTDKALLTQGKPTQIIDAPDSLDHSIERLLGDLAANDRNGSATSS